MTQKDGTEKLPEGRLMTLTEVAAELRLTRSAIYPKIYSGELAAVRVGKNGRGLRVLRASFDEYWERLQREAQHSFGGAA